MGPWAHGATPPGGTPRPGCRPKYVRPADAGLDFRLAIGSQRAPARPVQACTPADQGHGPDPHRPLSGLLHGIPCPPCVSAALNAPTHSSLRT